MPALASLVVDAAEVTLGGRPVLRGLSFTAPPASVTALLGPNGAGKTTTIRTLTGLIQLDAGRVEVLGYAPGDPRGLSRLGLMPQATGAWSGIRPGELLRYLASLYAHPQPVDELMAELGITTYARTPYRRLSGGQQQAVNLAGALIGRPEFVILDEPTAGMDPHARRRTWTLIRRLAESGVGVLLTTHGMEEASALADHVWIMDSGAVTVHGTVAELTATESLEDVFLHNTQERP